MRLLLAAKQQTIANAGAVSVDKSLPLQLFQDTYDLDAMCMHVMLVCMYLICILKTPNCFSVGETGVAVPGTICI